MGKIRVLPEILANKIAAGEIVERPASVVKELIENSIDANATRIEIEILKGGKRLIKVRDNGEGMNRDDALLAFEHHATSKIQTSSDLSCIKTLGFRGEALPSIASVSKLYMKTGEATSRFGTEVTIDGGVVKNVKEISWAGGTEISIGQLFFNIPARKKFLKTESTESSHVVRLVTYYALANPETYFLLKNNNRRILDAPPVKGLTERAYQVFGKQFLSRMIPFDSSKGSLRIHGIISHPQDRRSNTSSQYFFVNGRMVRDRLISIALSRVYKGKLPAGSYPAAVIFIEIPHEEIDVNVHPAKTEIRFRNAWDVQNFIQQILEDALVGAKAFSTLSSVHFPEKLYKEKQTIDNINTAGKAITHLREKIERYRPADSSKANIQKNFNFDYRQGITRDIDIIDVKTTMQAPSFPGLQDFMGWRVLGQWRNSYIVATSMDELMIIDQHVAHERVLYEKYLEQLKKEAVPKQRLLIPISVELSPHQKIIIDELSKKLRDNGFEIEPFGQNSIKISAVPSIAKDCEIEQLIAEILNTFDEEVKTFSIEEVQQRLASALACHAAVKANTPLSITKMSHLLDMLLEAKDPTTCPHGRPVVLKIHIRDIEKDFERT